MSFVIGGIPQNGTRRIFIKSCEPLETTPHVEQALTVISEQAAERLAKQYKMQAISI